MNVACIDIKNLRLRTYIGFNNEERSKRQDVVINVKIAYSPESQILDDDVEAALNYKTITKRIIALVEKGRFLLLERLVGDVLNICSDESSVNYARVCIDKPHALRFADSVAVSAEYHAH